MPQWAKMLLVALVAFAAMQLVRFDHVNPPVTADIRAPADAKAVLRRACYDCHSNETVWPWYANVAPASWLVQYDVMEGRENLNFSEWGGMHPDDRAKKQGFCGDQVTADTMPPLVYRPLHGAAALSEADVALIEKWARGPVSE